MKEQFTSKHGEGTGGPGREVTDPNEPSFDPAAYETKTDEKIRLLLGPVYARKLLPWEKRFLINNYGQVPLPRRAHVTVAQIFNRLTGPANQATAT
jgi:hypothetical protein